MSPDHFEMEVEIENSYLPSKDEHSADPHKTCLVSPDQLKRAVDSKILHAGQMVVEPSPKCQFVELQTGD